LDQIAELQKKLNNSIYCMLLAMISWNFYHTYVNLIQYNSEFDIVVNPKQKPFKWIANIEQETLCDLKKTIFAVYEIPELENDRAIFNFVCVSGNYFPKVILTFVICSSYLYQK
jgi:hypothetical protein